MYRCCEYALLTLEHWPDAPEIQRSVDLYEDLIRCCVADAMSEVGFFVSFSIILDVMLQMLCYEVGLWFLVYLCGKAVIRIRCNF